MTNEPIAQLIRNNPQIRAMCEREWAKAINDLRQAEPAMREYRRAAGRLTARMVASGNWIRHA